MPNMRMEFTKSKRELAATMESIKNSKSNVEALRLTDNLTVVCKEVGRIAFEAFWKGKKIAFGGDSEVIYEKKRVEGCGFPVLFVNNRNKGEIEYSSVRQELWPLFSSHADTIRIV